MPRSFLLTNRRYIPTPPPPGEDVVDHDDGNNNNNNNEGREDGGDEEGIRGVLQEDCVEAGTAAAMCRPSTELMVAHILLRQAEQTEAVNLALNKPCPRPRSTPSPLTTTITTTTTTTHLTSPIIINNNNNYDIDKNHHTIVINDSPSPFDTQVACDQYLLPAGGCSSSGGGGGGGGGGVGGDGAAGSLAVSVSDSASEFYHLPDHPPRPTVIYSVNSGSSSSSSTNSGSNNNHHHDMTGTYVSGSYHTDVAHVGMDLRVKGDPRSPPLSHPGALTADGEGQDKAGGLSDGDSDSGCSTQNEARSHLPPEVEYGWAECQAHFSLLYDLMTQNGRKLPGKDNEQAGYAGKEEPEQVPFDYSHTPTREAPIQEPPVLYELMTESPRKASGRDVPEHAMEVEVSMQQYPPHHHHQTYQQLQPQPQSHLSSAHKAYHSQQQSSPQHVPPPRAPYDDHRRATLQEVAHDRGLVHVNANPAPPRYEPRRSLNDLLFAAGLPPVSPPTPPPPPSSMSPSASPLSAEELHTCEECGKRYSTSSNLARHRQTHRSHGDKKARKCPHCDKVYVSMPAFSMHVRTHNQGCACPHCGKRFSRPWLLQGHIRTHTGEKPFACPQCGKSFADKSNLRAHIQTHSSEKPYVCGRCGKAFALKSYLYKHEESSCMRGERFRPLRRQVSVEC